MLLYDIGKTIQKQRIAQNISQGELCNGLCSVGTLSKIEKGDFTPKRNLADALIERLGLSSEQFNSPVGKEEFERYIIECDIKRHSEISNVSLEELLEKYKNCGPMDNLEEQLYLKWKGKICKENKIDYLLQAICKTIPDFSKDNITEYKLLSCNEIDIIIGIAIFEYNSEKKTQQAKKRLNFLMRYLRNNVSNILQTIFIPIVLNQISGYEEDEGNYEMELELANEGLMFARQGIRLDFIERLIFNKAVALLKLKHEDEAKKLFIQCLNIIELKGNLELRSTCIEGLKKLFGESFMNFPKTLW